MFVINMKLFCRNIPQLTILQKKVLGHASNISCYVFPYPPKKKRCICYMIHESSKTFLLMQWFEVTVINK